MKMHKARYLGTSSGMSAMGQARWDILGNGLGVPAWQLIGGKHWERLRVYANGWYQGLREPAFFADAAAAMVAKDYAAFRFDPFGEAYQQIDKEGEALAVAIVRALREAAEPEVDLLPDSPGWGVELDEEAAAAHPYGETNILRLFEEG